MSVQEIKICAELAGQRIDNFLKNHLKGVPISRIYKAIRKGEVRVNKGRVKALYKLQADDVVRIPPLRVSKPSAPFPPGRRLQAELERRIVMETPELLVMNKPSGLPVHGGTDISAGLIESLRLMRPEMRYLELVHRLDRATSGVLVMAKKRSMLRALHGLLTQRKVQKMYLAFVKGEWQGGAKMISLPLLKNTLQSGERVVRVDELGKPSQTRICPVRCSKEGSLLAVYPKTGRTHQIRVHLSALGHPIAGDEKYGNTFFNQRVKELGLKRLFLHSASFSCQFDDSKNVFGVCIPLEKDLKTVLNRVFSLYGETMTP